jgi:hypothetical protein
MARKKSEKSKMAATDVEMRFVRLQLPVEDHRKLRRLAADEDTNMAILTRRIVQEYLARHTPKGGSK